MELPKEDWITVDYVPFFRMEKYYKCSSICTIPFPKNKYSYFHIARPIKLFDYMAAGKPIISLYLDETTEIINRYNCGIIVDSYQEMGEAIEYLYRNQDIVKILGNNGRKAVEEEFNWHKRVKELSSIIREMS